jgi:membrane fusion protein (multidrug efflux system)
MVAQQRPVATGARQQGFVEITDGVQAGDRIIADGLNKIQSGQTVRAVGQVGDGPHSGLPGQHPGGAGPAA